MPPPVGHPFCKPSYACPYYVWGRPWFGVAYDLYSVGATLWTAVEGKALYAAPSHQDRRFALLLESDKRALRAAAGLFVAPVAAAASVAAVGPAAGGGLLVSPPPPATFESYLVTHSERDRVPFGRAAISPELQDLLAKLLRVTPHARPPSVDAVLSHPWFEGVFE